MLGRDDMYSGAFNKLAFGSVSDDYITLMEEYNNQVYGAKTLVSINIHPYQVFLKIYGPCDM